MSTGSDRVKRPLEQDDLVNADDHVANDLSPEIDRKRLKSAEKADIESGEFAPSVAVNLACFGAADGSITLTERDLFITEYVGQHEGFKGVIKQRYSDFMVTEVDLQSKITSLDNVNLPEEENNLPNIDTVLDKGTLDKLSLLEEDDNAPSVIIEVENMSKEQRRIVHELLRNCYTNVLSNTEDLNGTKVIVATKSKVSASQVRNASPKGRFDNKFQKGARQNWPAFRGNFTHFTLYKENIDTMEAINLIGKFLGIKPGSFAYSGVKDKRAKTLQRVSVYRVEAIRLLKLNVKLRRMMIGNVGYFKEPLKLGDLSGNRFQIALRNVKGSSSSIDDSLRSLSENGFINYYGMQRFGTTCVPTHAIGLALLKCDWKLAVELILKPRPGDDESVAQARKLWMADKDATKAFAALRNRNSNEGNLLRGLEAHGTNDLINALNFIPRNMRLMYVHSYQSYVWNHVVSKRIAKYGLSMLEGDLILNDGLPLEPKDEDSEDAQDLKRDGKDRILPKVLKTGQTCTIYDVVLPLFGYDVQYPANEIHKWYDEILKGDGLDINNVRHKVKVYSLSGSYRRMVVRPQELKWSTVKYKDPNQPLFTSAYDVMKHEQAADVTNRITADSNELEGESVAVKLEFTLPSSSYATMALREILRADTSASFQSTLNQI